MSEDRRSLPIKQNIRWPQGKHPDKFRKAASKSSQQLLTGRVLSIDPASGSSSMPGWALFEAGELVASGTIELNSKQPIQKRLNTLFYALTNDFNSPSPDVIIIEEIRGSMAHAFLFWACGVIVSVFGDAVLLELPISFWKAILPEDYEKSDATDAAYIGLAVITLVREHGQ